MTSQGQFGMSGDMAAFAHRAASVAVEIRPYFYMAVTLFLLGAIVGMLFPGISLARIDVLKEFAQSLRGLSASSLMALIFAKNASAAAVSIALGALLGIAPVIGAFTNGLLLGGLMLIDPAGMWRIIPHGIFELPAMFLAWGTGIWIGLWFRAHNRLATLGHRLRQGAWIFLLAVVPLLFVAAVIEGAAAARLWAAS